MYSLAQKSAVSSSPDGQSAFPSHNTSRSTVLPLLHWKVGGLAEPVQRIQAMSPLSNIQSLLGR